MAATYERTAASRQRRTRIHLPDDKPFGILHMGDPHIDNPGSDVGSLRRHVELIQQTPGLYGGNVGDLQDNWIGRLSRLYAHRNITAGESWRLVEWLVTSVQWLYLVRGNHDQWSGDGDPLDWIATGSGAPAEPHESRLKLITPAGHEVRITTRHRWPGHSMWNTAHGIARAAQRGHGDDILIGGDRHISGYQVIKQPDGTITHCIQVASYKRHDDFAKEKGFVDANIFFAPVTVTDPRLDPDDPRRTTFFMDPNRGAEFLTMVRNA